MKFSVIRDNIFFRIGEAEDEHVAKADVHQKINDSYYKVIRESPWKALTGLHLEQSYSTSAGVKSYTYTGENFLWWGRYGFKSAELNNKVCTLWEWENRRALDGTDLHRKPSTIQPAAYAANGKIYIDDGTSISVGTNNLLLQGIAKPAILQADADVPAVDQDLHELIEIEALIAVAKVPGIFIEGIEGFYKERNEMVANIWRSYGYAPPNLGNGGGKV